MATLSLQCLCLLLLLPPLEILALDCQYTAEYQLQVNNPGVQILMEAIGRPQLSLQCLYKIPSFGFPGVNIHAASKESKRLAVKIILEKIMEIFEQNFSQTGWDAGAVALLQDALYQQTSQWETCSITATGEAATYQDLNLNLRRYFRQIQRFLESQQYSLCAWSIVQLEIKNIFFVYLDQLLKRF